MLLTKFSHDVWKKICVSSRQKLHTPVLYLQGNHRHSISDFSDITEAIHLSLQHPKITGTVGWSLVDKEWPVMKAPKPQKPRIIPLNFGVCVANKVLGLGLKRPARGNLAFPTV